MIAKKRTKPAKSAKPRARRPKNWRDAVRRYLSKVSAVDAVYVYVSAASGTVHVYSIVEQHGDDSCGPIMEQEDKVEKAFPRVSFEFYTRAHQGRHPSEVASPAWELLYLR